MAELLNTALSSGTYDGVLTGLTGVSTVQTVDGLSLTKSADKQRWADGDLTYTLTLENLTALPYTGVTITDTLNTSLIQLIEDSIMIGNTPVTDYTYDEGTGELILFPATPQTVDAGDTLVITFQVERSTP